MKYSKSLILFFFIATIVCFITKVNGKEDSDDERMIYKIDSDGNMVSYKKVKKGENGDISDEENVVSDDSETEKEEIEDELGPEEDNEFFPGNYITVHLGNFIDHPYENEEYYPLEEPNITESVEEEEVNVDKKVEKDEKDERVVESINENKKENIEEINEINENINEEEVEKREEKIENENSQIIEENKSEDIDQNRNENNNDKENEDENGNMEENNNNNDNENEDENGEEGDVEVVTEYGDPEIVTEYADQEIKPIVEENVVEVEIVMDDSVIITKNKEMDEFFKRNEKMVIGCFDSFGNEDYVNFRNASFGILSNPNEASENYFNGEVLKFVNINDKQCRNTVKRFTGISMFKNDVVYCIHKRCYEYDPKDLVDVDKLKQFIDNKEMPYVSEYDPKRKEEYKQWNLPFLVYLNNDEKKTKEDVANFLSEVAEKHRNDFYVLISNDKTFDIDSLDEPRENNVLLYAPEFQTLYSIQEILEENDAIDKPAIESFLHQYELGLLTPRLVYQDFERIWDQEGFVVNSVPRYYYPTVMNPTRDSLVIYYKSDCPYSQEFLKTFEKLGRKYSNYRTKFSVVKFEAEDQKIPKMSLWRKLEAYPTVVLYKANPLSRNKKDFYIYPDDAGRSAVTVDRWVQHYSFYKPKAIFNDEDYKEKEVLEADWDELVINEEEEERISRLLEEPNLIFTRYGYGKELQVVNDDDEDSGEEEADFFFDNVKTDTIIPMTGTYYELLATTYTTRVSTYTPPPSIYDDDEEENKEENANK